MIKVSNIKTYGFSEAITAMRSPMNSWERSDSYYGQDNRYHIGKNDLELMKKLNQGGPVHATYRRFINAYMEITAPIYWWKEMDRYRFGKEQVSTSTMHKIHAKPFELSDFSGEHLLPEALNQLKATIDTLNCYRNFYNEGVTLDGVVYPPKSKEMWWQLIQLLPSSYNQRRSIMMSYEVLVGLYEWRKNHKLDEWVNFCKILKDSLPYSELFTME